MVRFAIVVALTTALIAGCGGITVEQRRNPGDYSLAKPYGKDPNYREMVKELSARAESLCPGGYRKITGYDTAVGPKGWRLVWEIRCNYVPQAFWNIPGAAPAEGSR